MALRPTRAIDMPPKLEISNASPCSTISIQASSGHCSLMSLRRLSKALSYTTDS
ncbi:MAG: hypothetical protein ACHP83_02315 [Burkholderiales bacterium]